VHFDHSRLCLQVGSVSNRLEFSDPDRASLIVPDISASSASPSGWPRHLFKLYASQHGNEVQFLAPGCG